MGAPNSRHALPAAGARAADIPRRDEAHGVAGAACRALPALCVAALLAGCATTPLPTLEPSAVPDAWRNGEEDAKWPPLDWWQAFGSAELTALIGQVRARNFDLDNSARALRSAELALADAGLDRWPRPTIAASASTGYAGSGKRGDFADSGAESIELSLRAPWADIAERRPRHQAARATFDSAVAQAADTRLRVLTTTASAYFQLLLLRDREQTARANIENANAIAGIVNARVDAGVALASDALRQRIVARRQRNALRTLELDVLKGRATLALLVGRSVWDFDLTGTTLGDVRAPAVSPGLPSGLLTRRPDIVQAEAALREAHANVDLARLAFLPRMDLATGATASSSAFGSLAARGATALTVTTDLALTLFDVGRRQRRLETSRLRMESLLADYQRAVIAAFNEVEIALADLRVLRSLADLLADDTRLAEESLRIAEARYREGEGEFEALLGAQTTLYTARDAALNNKLGILQAVLALYQALGGGWRMDDPPRAP